MEGRRGADQTVSDLVVRFGEMLPSAFSVLRRDGRSVWANAAYCDLVGLTFADVMARTVAQAVHPDDLPRCLDAMARAGRGEVVELELRTLHAAGHWLHVRWRMRHDVSTEFIYAVGLNVSDERRVRDALRHEARHDGLTGAANRTQVMRTLARWQAQGREVAVAIIDVDGFKSINDRMGHPVGDAVLQALVERLRHAVAPTGVVGRMGGDEFVALVPLRDARVAGQAAAEPATVAAPVEDLSRRLADVSGSVTVLGRRIRLSASIGIAAGEGTDPEQLLQEADAAAYVAKRDGPGRLRFFDEAMRQVEARRREVEAHLVDALDADTVELLLQPIVDVRHGAVVGAEALARLQRSGAAREPDELVDVAERLGLLPAVSLRIRGAAMDAAVSLPDHVAVHLNLGTEDLMGPGGLLAIADLAAQHGVEPEGLVLELTEQTLLRDRDAAVLQLQAVRALGVRIAIDDFGVGASSLSRISTLPVDVLKIDRSFVSDAREDSAARAVLGAVTSLGPALGVDVVLQGIETAADLAVARDLGVTAVQGGLLGMPMSVPSLADHLASHHP